MSPFQVDWVPDVLGDLANIWRRATDRKAVTQAQAEIDRLLSRDPLRYGQHLAEGLYQLRVTPLQVTFTINYPLRHVEVTSIRRQA